MEPKLRHWRFGCHILLQVDTINSSTFLPRFKLQLDVLLMSHKRKSREVLPKTNDLRRLSDMKYVRSFSIDCK